MDSWYGKAGKRKRVAIRLEGFLAADDSKGWPRVNPYLDKCETSARHFIDGVGVWFKHRGPSRIDKRKHRWVNRQTAKSSSEF